MNQISAALHPSSLILHPFDPGRVCPFRRVPTFVPHPANGIVNILVMVESISLPKPRGDFATILFREGLRRYDEVVNGE
jgi:hypothetical protein